MPFLVAGRRGLGLARRLATLATEPGRTLRVAGPACGALVVRTNMETYEATVDGAALARASADGDLHVETGAGEAVTVSVPASFNVHVDLHAAACDVELQGWLEGTVDVAVGTGSIAVGTVRGLLTSLRSGRGDVRVEHVEGNLDVSAAAGSVALGKVLAQDVRVAAPAGVLRARALYTKALAVEAGGGMRASVVGAESARLELGGSSSLDSTEGDLAIDFEGDDLVVQASENLRRLAVASSRAPPTDDAPAPSITVHLPEGAAPRGQLRARALTLDERLGATSDGAAEALLGGGAAEGCELSVLAEGCDVEVDVQSWFEQRMKAAEKGGEARAWNPKPKERY